MACCVAAPIASKFVPALPIASCGLGLVRSWVICVDQVLVPEANMLMVQKSLNRWDLKSEFEKSVATYRQTSVNHFWRCLLVCRFSIGQSSSRA